MKRFIAASCLAVVLAGGVAGSANALELQLGARVGGGLNILSDNGPRDYNMGWGVGAGLALKHALTEQLSISPEMSLLYRSLASYGYDVVAIITSKTSFPEMAISIPVMVQYAPIENVPFYIAAGLQLEIPFASKTKTKTTTTILGSSSETTTISDNNDRSSTDFGIPIGIGYIVTENIGIDFRFVINVTSALQSWDSSHFMSLGLGATYFFK